MPIYRLYLVRLIPLVEKNFNLVELGPRGTGKSYVFRELSPYAILLSGGQVTIPKLFASNAPPYEPGLVTRWDVVAFDEVAGSHFRKPEDKQLYKDYMELGSFSRGSAKGTIQGEAGFVFNGNLDGEVETIARTSHLFLPFPDTVRNDMAFHDRWHTDLGMAFYIALLSATLGRGIGAQLVVLGQMSLHGVLSRVEGLGDKLRMAMDAGVRRVLSSLAKGAPRFGRSFQARRWRR